MKAITGGKLIVPDERGIFRVLSEHAILYGQNIERIVPESKLSIGEHSSFEEIIDAKGAYVSPGFVNVHIHGAMGADAMDDDAEAVLTLAHHQASTGVTCFLPTTMTCPIPAIRRALSHIRAAMKQRGLTLEESGNLPLRGNADMLTQLAENLAANAVQHASEGGKITVSAEKNTLRIRRFCSRRIRRAVTEPAPIITAMTGSYFPPMKRM